MERVTRLSVGVGVGVKLLFLLRSVLFFLELYGGGGDKGEGISGVLIELVRLDSMVRGVWKLGDSIGWASGVL